MAKITLVFSSATGPLAGRREKTEPVATTWPNHLPGSSGQNTFLKAALS